MRVEAGALQRQLLVEGHEAFLVALGRLAQRLSIVRAALVTVLALNVTDLVSVIFAVGILVLLRGLQ